MKVLIGLPTRGYLFHGVSSFLIQQKEKGHTIYKHTTALSVEIGRMSIVRYFLDKDFTHLFFLDDDVVCQDYSIEKLAEYDKSIVSLNYPIYRNNHLHSSAYKGIKGFYKPIPFDEVGLQEVDGIGLGGCLIKRDVLENVIDCEPFRISFNESGEIETGDDIKFCQVAKKLNYQIWCDFSLKADHYKLVSLRSVWDNFVLG